MENVRIFEFGWKNLRRSKIEVGVEGLKMEVLERESVNKEEVRKKKKRKGEKEELILRSLGAPDQANVGASEL